MSASTVANGGKAKAILSEPGVHRRHVNRASRVEGGNRDGSLVDFCHHRQ